MKLGDAFPSKYLSGKDIGDNLVRVKIKDIEMDDVSGDGEMKPLMYFEGKKKALILNKTNYSRLGLFFPDFAASDDSDDLIGKEVIIYTELITFQGSTNPACRLKAIPKEKAEGEPEDPGF